MVAVRPGIRLGVDPGTVRVGVARSDPDGVLATPLETVEVVAGDDGHLVRIGELAAEVGAIELLVGLPRTLTGAEGSAAGRVRAYADLLAQRVAPLPVRLVDERFSTVSAHRKLREAGVQGRRRRPVIDQAAAVEILQSALEEERRSGRPPGVLVIPDQAAGGPDRPGADEEATTR